MIKQQKRRDYIMRGGEKQTKNEKNKVIKTKSKLTAALHFKTFMTNK